MIFECDRDECFLSADGEITGICIGRYINGLTINGMEYVYAEDNKNILLFPDRDHAIRFLKDHGCTDWEIRQFHFFYHTACPHCGMWLLVEDCDTTNLLVFAYTHYSSFAFAILAISPTPFNTIVGR